MISAKSKTKRITITFEIPEDIDAKNSKMMLKDMLDINYLLTNSMNY